MKSDLFEDFVANMFPEEHFTLIHKNTRKDIFSSDLQKSENSAKPDFQFACKKTGESFWVECKYRTNTLDNGSIHWCEEHQLNRYKKKRTESDNKTYIMMGLGGIPNHPDKIYCLDLDKIAYNTIYKSSYERFEIYVPYFQSLNHLRQITMDYAQQSKKDNLNTYHTQDQKSVRTESRNDYIKNLEDMIDKQEKELKSKNEEIKAVKKSAAEAKHITNCIALSAIILLVITIIGYVIIRHVVFLSMMSTIVAAGIISFLLFCISAMGSDK